MEDKKILLEIPGTLVYGSRISLIACPNKTPPIFLRVINKLIITTEIS